MPTPINMSLITMRTSFSCRCAEEAMHRAVHSKLNVASPSSTSEGSPDNLITHAEAEEKHALRFLPRVDRLGRLAEQESIAADVYVPGAEVAGDGGQWHCEEGADVEEPELVVHAVQLVVVVRAQAQLDRDRDRRLSAGHRPARSDAELDVGALVRSAVGPDRAELLGEQDIGGDLV